ncbi:50S ribosomal protein L7/L12-serine acetyltransferase [Bartonella machadoae]|uniref:50S ribosomal protein L7/L12-serine acetyltransferase n=1 Tax=Bartonella machadoae TaxID=2893471 RepID=UPI001F4D3525|nr:50S ribosomal protein L7/L12-serine acetyltransferase [Bartonella machadoae]UNE54512.1 50S ribosomal protein L7/L12-serine acetyltransferase [Bartonella machadoae]
MITQKIISKHIIQTAIEIINRPKHSDLPFFLFDADNTLVEMEKIILASKKYFANASIAVSLQSCSLGIFFRLLAEKGLNVEVCSADEWRLASAIGFPDDRIILDGSFKTTEDMSLTLKKNAPINVETINAFHELMSLAANKGKRYGVSIKLSHSYRKDKSPCFGITKEEYIRDILPLLSKSEYIYLKGFHFHIDSNVEHSAISLNPLSDWLSFLVEYMPSSGYLYINNTFLADCIASSPEHKVCNSESFFHSIHDVLKSYDPDLLKKWKLIFKPNYSLIEKNSYAVGKTIGYKHHDGVQIIQTNLNINQIPSLYNLPHPLTLLDDLNKNPSDNEQILTRFICCNNYLCLEKNHGLKEGQHFLIRGCRSYDMQTTNEWLCKRLPIYVWLKGNILTARMPSPTLSALSKDLLHNEENLYVDDNIRLTTPSRKFAPALYESIHCNREYFSKFMAWPRFVNHENDTANFLDSCFLAHQKDEGKTYVILFKEHPVGLLSFNTIDHENKTGYIGYWLDRKAQGNGIITRAIRTLVKHYSSHHFLKRFVIKCATANQKSNAVAKRCGFEFEGTFKQAEYLNGVFHDQNIYSWISPDN